MELTPAVLASTKEQTLTSTPWPKCYMIKTYFRLCGEVQTSYLHTDLCVSASIPGWAQELWSTILLESFPLGKHIASCVGECERCQTSAEQG